jgi:hypothetical protein
VEGTENELIMLTEQKKLILHKTPRNVSSSLWHSEKAKMKLIQSKSLHNNRQRGKVKKENYGNEGEKG